MLVIKTENSTKFWWNIRWTIFTPEGKKMPELIFVDTRDIPNPSTETSIQ